MGNGAPRSVRARSNVWSQEESSITRICVSCAASEDGIRRITSSRVCSALYATMKTSTLRIAVLSLTEDVSYCIKARAIIPPVSLSAVLASLELLDSAHVTGHVVADAFRAAGLDAV